MLRLATFIALIATVSAHADDAALFENKIRPILVEHCYECHSADKKQKGNLLLDTAEATLRGGDTGPAVVPGDPVKSLLLKAVKWEDEDFQMPPKTKLSDAQIADLEAWVKAGAPDPRSGPRTLTKIEQHLEDAKKHWSLQPIFDPKPASLDALVGTTGKAPADKRTLIRRAYFDLIGVPPTYAEVNAFAADNDPKAFEKLIDKLLADKRYGERWGRHWLDVVRYADNMGSIYNGDDNYPNAFTYRDYVIDAFNTDKPYDRFLLEQIAADQLDTAKDTRTLAAMGFLGLGRRKDRRVDDDMYDDTIDVIGRGLMGLTIGCARCHDHKLEPITTKDYYALYSVLRSSKEPEIQPALPQADTPQTREYAEKNKAARTEYIRVIAFEADRSMSALRSRVGDYLQAAKDSEFKTIYEGKTVKADILDPRRLLNGPHGRVVKFWDKWVKGHPEVFTPWLELSALSEADFTAKAKPLCEAYGKNADKKLLVSVARAFSKATPKNLRDVADIYNNLYTSQIDTLWAEKWREPLKVACVPTAEELDLPLKELEPRAIDRLNTVQKANALPEAEDQALRAIFIEDGSPFYFTGKDFLSSQLYSTRDVAEGLRRNVTKALTELQNHPGAPARAMTFVDADKMYDGKVFIRGNPQTRGPDAPRQFLTALKHISPEPFPKDKSGRLQLAQAIANKSNPLTARVIVNRVWGWHFGDAIVGTPSDFGFRGDKPTNQTLLDHLAAWFMDNGWSFKKLHKHLMLTAAYQRADFPMRPLDLEPFRDTLLAVTGRLKPDLGGKPEKIADTTRRTVYAFVDRKTLPSIYRSFDFPDPNFSAPKRSRTALTPRALILMNSPLLTDSAKTLADSLTKTLPDDTSRIEELYRRVFQRQPTDKEMQRAHDYLAAYPKNDLVHPESQDWQYGYGTFDAAAKQTTKFASLTAFDGKAFKGTLKTADGKPGEVKVDAMGGDSGLTSSMSSIRRWIAPLDGEINITAELTHTDAKTEGVIARIISSRSGELGEWKAKAQSLCTDLAKVSVKKGDTLDFIVSSQTDKDAGPYQWSPSITMPTADMPAMPGMAKRWDARVDFANPNAPAKPLTAWEELCQAILLSPEFAVME
jgi:mono/diheme cytochrome c family protein